MQAIIRKDEEAVSPVIATILMVAITVVLAAVLYVMVSGLLTGPGTNKPQMTFSGVTLGSGATVATFTIADTSQSVSYSTYKFNMKVNGTFGTAKALGSSGTVVSMSAILGDVYTLTYTDVGNDGTVNGGDQFAVGNVQSNSQYVFVLLWSDGSQVQFRDWTTP